MRGNVTLIIALMFFLVAVAYYAGLSTDIKAFASSTNMLANTLTGRDSTGKFAGYPPNGPTV